MCSFDIHSAIELIAEIFDIDEWEIEYPPNYNVAPSQDILIVNNEGKRRLVRSRWGLVPAWAKELSAGNKLINARSESLAEKPSFKKAFEKQRCLVVANGYYQWEQEGKVKKPYYVRLKSGKPFGFAGLYNIWTSPEGKQITTSTIITTDANELLQPLHDRMPVILPPDKYDLWLDPSVHDKDVLTPILKPFPSEEMEFYRVTPKMNSTKYNDADNIKPLSDIEGP